MAKERGEGLPNFEVQPEEVGEQRIHPEAVEQPKIDSSPTFTPDIVPSEVNAPKDIQKFSEVGTSKEEASPDFDHIVAPGERDLVDLQAELSWGDTEPIRHLDG